MKILLNHVGFEPQAPKLALLQASAADRPQALILLDRESRPVQEIALQALGMAEGWPEWHYWQADFSAWTQPGQYRLWRRTARRRCSVMNSRWHRTVWALRCCPIC